MAKVIGHNGVVKIGANTVAGVARFTLDETMEPVEDTDLTDTAKAFQSGDTSWRASVECKWDKADATGQGAMTIGASVTLYLQPEGDTLGQERRGGTGLIVGRGAVNEKGSMVMQSFEIQGTGALTVDTVP